MGDDDAGRLSGVGHSVTHVTCIDCGGTGQTYAFDGGWQPETCIRCWGDGEVEWHGPRPD